MNMLVNVILGSANLPHYRMVLEKFAKTIPNVIVSETYTESDVAVIFGSWKDRKAKHHVIKNDMLARHAGPFIVLETPLIGRRIEDEYVDYRIGINHYLRSLGDFNNTNRPGDRWQLLKNKFDLNLNKWRTNGEHIVVAMQLPGDASMLGTDTTEWATQMVGEIRKYTDRKIVIRPHKIIREYNMDLINACLKAHRGVEFVDPKDVMSRDDLANAWATVTYTSGFGVDSLINGVPNFSMHPGSHAFPLTQPISNIETPVLADREKWIHDLSYAQWDVDEIEQGLPWKHLEGRVCQYM